MNADYKAVLIESLKGFDAKSKSNVETAVSLITETIAMTYTKADLSAQEKVFLYALKTIEKNPDVLDLEKIKTQSSSYEITLTVVSEILEYFKQYLFGITEMESIVNGLKA